MEQIQDPAFVAEFLAKLDQIDHNGMWGRFSSYASSAQTPEPTTRVRPHYRRLIIAATIIALLGIGTWSLFHTPNPRTTNLVAKSTIQDVAGPASNHATITLSSQAVSLDSLSKGPMITEGETSIAKGTNGEVGYKKVQVQRSALPT